MAKKRTTKKTAKKPARKAAKKSAVKRKKPVALKPAARAPKGAKSSGAVAASMIGVCRGLPGVTEDMKWGDNLIFSVGGKMFAGFDTDGTEQFAFKCDDIDFDRLIEVDGIIPAPYAARFAWVKVLRGNALPASELRGLLAKAHEIVLACLPKKKQEAIRTAAAGAR